MQLIRLPPALEDAAKRQLISIRDTKKAQVEDYFGTIRSQIISFSDDHMFVRAFSLSFNSSSQSAEIDSVREASGQAENGSEQTTTAANELAQLVNYLQQLISQFKIS